MAMMHSLARSVRVAGRVDVALAQCLERQLLQIAVLEERVHHQLVRVCGLNLGTVRNRQGAVLKFFLLENKCFSNLIGLIVESS